MSPSRRNVSDTRQPRATGTVHERTQRLCEELRGARAGCFSDVVRTLTVGLPRLLAPLRWTGTYLAVQGGQLRRLAGLGAGDVLPRLSELALFHGINDLGRPIAIGDDGGGSIASAPILDGETVLGLLVVQRAGGDPDLGEEELGALTEIAGVVAEVLHREHQARPGDLARSPAPERTRRLGSNPPQPLRPTGTPPVGIQLAKPSKNRPRGRLSRDQVEQIRRVEEDLRTARKIQQRFLPSLPQMWPSDQHVLLIAAEYRPAFEVGGDFYDLVHLAPHRFISIVGDVSGKGVSAALIMTRAMSEFRHLAERGRGPGEILCAMNAALLERGIDDSFITAVCVEVDTTRSELVIANAGHFPPLLREGDGTIRILSSESGVPLGLWAVDQYAEQRHHFGFEDVVLLMTDGMTDAFDTTSPDLDSKLARTIAAGPRNVHDLVRELLAALELGRSRHHHDDVAVLGLQLARQQSGD